MATIESIALKSKISLEEETWESLFEKGKICEGENDMAEAVLYYKLSLELCTKRNGIDSLDNAEILKKLCNLCYNQNQYSESLEFSTKLVKLLEKNNKKDTNDYINAYETISRSQFCLGQLKDSEKNYNITISLYEKLKGKHSIEVAILFMYLGNVFRQSEENDRALEEFTKSEEICSGKSEESFCLQLARVTYAKANIYRIKNEPAKSFEYVLKSMRILEGQGRTMTTEYADNLFCLVQLYLDCGQTDEARERLDSLSEIIQKVRGTQTIDYAKVLLLKAGFYLKIGAFRGALQFSKTALELIEKTFGEESLYTNNALEMLSIAYEKENIYSEAIRCTSRSYKNNIRFLGESHEVTLKSKNRLDQLRNMDNKSEFY